MEKMKKGRLKFEIKDLKKYQQFSLDIDESNNNILYISFQGTNKTLYENEKFKLKFHFGKNYVNNNYI